MLVEHGVEEISNGWKINTDGASRGEGISTGLFDPRSVNRWALEFEHARRSAEHDSQTDTGQC